MTTKRTKRRRTSSSRGSSSRIMRRREHLQTKHGCESPPGFSPQSTAGSEPYGITRQVLLASGVRLKLTRPQFAPQSGPVTGPAVNSTRASDTFLRRPAICYESARIE